MAAEAKTRRVTCGPTWAEGGGYVSGVSVKIRISSWVTAPSVHRNVSYVVLLRDARTIVSGAAGWNRDAREARSGLAAVLRAREAPDTTTHRAMTEFGS
jgi:hypothetical protein